MKLDFRTLRGTLISFDIDNNKTVNDVTKILNVNYSIPNGIQLILHSEVLDQSKTLNELKYSQYDIIVINYAEETPRLPKRISLKSFTVDEPLPNNQPLNLSIAASLPPIGTQDITISLASKNKQNLEELVALGISRNEASSLLQRFENDNLMVFQKDIAYQSYSSPRKIKKPIQKIVPPSPVSKRVRPPPEKIYDVSELARHNFGPFQHLLSTLTNKEQAALIRLLPLGDNDAETLQEFIANDKDETIARNYFEERNHH